MGTMRSIKHERNWALPWVPVVEDALIEEARKVALHSDASSEQLASRLARDVTARSTLDGGPVARVLLWSHTGAMSDRASRPAAKQVRRQVSRGLHPDMYKWQIAEGWAYMLAFAAIQETRVGIPSIGS